MKTIGAELGGIQLVTALATLPVGMPDRTRPVTTVRLRGPRGFSDYRVVWFGDGELYVLNGASEALTRKFVLLDGGSSGYSVDLFSGCKAYIRLDADTLLIRPSANARWRVAALQRDQPGQTKL